MRCLGPAGSSDQVAALHAATPGDLPTAQPAWMLCLLLPGLRSQLSLSSGCSHSCCQFIPPDNLVSHGTTWAVVGLAAPRDAACQGLALTQPCLLLALTDISHNPGPSSAGLWALGGCGHQPRAMARLQRQASAPAWPGLDEPKVCCRRRHHPASAGMGPACGRAPGERELRNPRHAQRHRNTRCFSLSTCKSHPQPHLPTVRSGQCGQMSCSPHR